MYGAKLLTPDQTAEKVREAAQHIRAAAKLLDDACCGAPGLTVQRIESVTGQSHIDRDLAERLEAAAAEISPTLQAAE